MGDNKKNNNSRFSVNYVNENPAFESHDEYGLISSLQSRTRGSSVSAEAPDNYLLSLRRLTREALPNIALYKDMQSIHRLNRPTLDELHNDSSLQKARNGSVKPSHDPEGSVTSEDAHSGHVKFGWIQGVLILNLMNLWGPMLFLRTSWLTGQGGIIQAILVILLSDLITVITALSTSAIATNGEVKGGGTYYMLSRSLGPEYGGAIGLIFAFANMVGVAMNLVGFCESFSGLLSIWNYQIIDGKVNDARIIGTVMCVVCVIICMVGMEWEAKAQNILLVILLTSIADVIVGSFLPVSPAQSAMGITGWNVTTAKNNLMADYTDGLSFFPIFSVYFPSATGILAGANISGELKDPQKAIPKGTLLAIMLTSISYISFVIVSGFCVVRDAPPVSNMSAVLDGVFIGCHPSATHNCSFGLHPSTDVLGQVAGTVWLVYAGNFAATVSSALACLVGAPRIFQALCRDKIYPKIYWFSKGYGKSDDPRRCYLLTFVIAVAFILIGSLDTVASLMSNFFMAAFCLINFACFHAGLAKSPGWRPGFRFWNKWVSLIGAILCFVIMFVMDYRMAIVTVVVCVLLYMYLFYKKPDVNWGSSAQAESYRKALISAQELNRTEEHVKNYRPQVLCLTGHPGHRPALIDFANYLTKGIGLMVCGNVIKKKVNHSQRKKIITKGYEWLVGRSCKAFYNVLEDPSLETGVKALIQLTGLGRLRPNLLMMGFKANWRGSEHVEVYEYFKLVHDAFDSQLAVAILRMPDGLDFSHFMKEDDVISLLNGTDSSSTLNASPETTVGLGDSGISLNSAGIGVHTISAKVDETEKKSKKDKKNKVDDYLAQLPKEIVDKVEHFHHKQNTGTIDIWWLYDDGGLTLLVPYLLKTRKHWRNCSLRVFTLANRSNMINEEQVQLASLLAKFRIDCKDVIIVPDILKKPKEATVRKFEEMVAPFREKGSDEDVEDENQMVISDLEMSEMKDKNKRYMRIHELIQEHSRNASLIVLTLPMPRKNRVSAALYMAWLDLITQNLPNPVLMIRGNQASVLTFYS